MTLITYVFLRLRPAKIVIRYMCIIPASDYPSKSNMVNGSQLCLNLIDSTYGIFIAQGEGNLVAKKSLLLICKGLRLFVNTMGDVDECSLPHRDNLIQPIHMQLSQKLKTFSRFFSAFWKSKLNFEDFQKNLDKGSLPHRYNLMQPIQIQLS